MLKTRNRIINFRVTEDEFRRLRDASLVNGARCLSDYARTSMLQALEGGYDRAVNGENYKNELQMLMHRMGLVERNFAKLESMLSRLNTDERKRVKVGASA